MKFWRGADVRLRGVALQTMKGEIDFPSLQKLKIAPERQPVRVFDEVAIKKLLTTHSEVVVVAPKEHRAAGETLVAKFKERGIVSTAITPGDVLRKVAYPRVWNPFAKVWRPWAEEKVKEPSGPVDHRVTVTSPADGVLVVDDKGKPAELRRPKTMITVGDGGWLDWSGDHEIAYEKGRSLRRGQRDDRAPECDDA